MFAGIVSPPMVTRSGTLSTTASINAFDVLGNAPLAIRTEAMTPRKPARAAGEALAWSRKVSVGLLVVASAAKAGPGLVVVMT